MTDYHVKQLDGSKCAGYNCAASSGAMGLFWQTGETLTGAGFRTDAGVSCVPGVHSNSGGLFISDVIRVYQEHGAVIDYGAKDDPPAYTRWAPPEMARRLQAGFGGVILGDYDALPRVYRASSTFLGDHSAWVHDHRVVLGVEQTHWHDPLRTAGLWIPISAVISYWQKATSPIRGYAGWVALRDPEGDMKIDALVRQGWTANGTDGVLRAAPVRSSPVTVRLAAGTVIVSSGEYFDTAGNSWRFAEYPVGSRQTVYLLRTGPGVAKEHDFLAGPIDPPASDTTTAFNAGVTAAAAAAAKAKR